ncbi:M20 family metallopeptidase, partial [Thermodesulfobacteriota bacterium]
PELALKEKRTAGIIADYLKKLGMDVSTGVGKTGVVALLEGNGVGRTLMLRADMDALPIEEKTGASYRSKNKGVMHACGHDGHIAIMLGVAKILSECQQEFKGKVKFVFQPGEEGYEGARLMVKDGVLESPEPDAALGLHLWNEIPVGQIGVKSGTLMASADGFEIKILGESGHGGKPDSGVDAIYIAGNVITSLQSLVSREVSAQTPLVVHIGTIHGGSAPNIIADEVKLTVVVRTLDKELRASIQGRLDRILKGITSAHRGSHEITYLGGLSMVVNDEGMTELIKTAAVNVVGIENVIEPVSSMGSEDMSEFLNAVPGCFFFVGARNEAKGIDHSIHHPLFDIDEAALEIGTETILRAALDYLNS